jgi:hypothetical protein
MIGSPALRDWTVSTGRSLRPLLADASPPAAISTAEATAPRKTGHARLCLLFGLTQRDVIRVLLINRANAGLESNALPN